MRPVATGPDDDAKLDHQAVRRLFGPAYDQMAVFAAMLASQGPKRGLIGPRETGRLWSRHLANCASLVPHLPAGGTVMDIGSGAGLPGVVLALARPDLCFELVDSMKRRITWLEEVRTRLGLSNVTLTWSRAQELAGHRQVEAVVSRAVGALDEMAAWAAELLKPGGLYLALKGRSAGQELNRCQEAMHHLGYEGLAVIEATPLANDKTFVVRGQLGPGKVGAVAHTGGGERKAT